MAQGSTASVMITGSNFLNPATISVQGTGVTISGVNVMSPTAITAAFTVAANAPSGTYNVAVSTAAGGQRNISSPGHFRASVCFVN